MSKEWTPSQKDAIQLPGNMLVSAGAGSGKTAVMIARICRLLYDEKDVRNMLVSTFTKTAAVDMKRKLYEAIRDSIENGKSIVDDSALSPEKIKWLKQQLGVLPSAEISTLHSWCAHLLKTWFFDAGIDPEFTVMEEGEESVYKSEAAEEAIAQKRAEGDAAFAGLYAAFLRNRKHKQLKEVALAVYDYARAQPVPEQWLTESAQHDDAFCRDSLRTQWLTKSAQHDDAFYRDSLRTKIKERINALRKKAEELMEECVRVKFDKDTIALSDLLACIDKGIAVTMPTPQLRQSKANAAVFDVYKPLHEKFKEYKEKYKALHTRAEQIENMPTHDDSLAYSKALVQLVELLDKKYDAVKKAYGKLDYSDLEHYALEVLKGKHGKEIVSSYKYVFVDEYQDISPLQDQILSHFGCEMFFVGDVKQSIYGFRMCSPDFFREKRERYRKGEGKTIELTDNFRSGKIILDAVNDVFGQVMTDKFGGTDYRTEEMHAGEKLALPAQVKSICIPEDKTKAEPPQKIYSVQNDTEERVNQGLVQEADAVVREIACLLETEECIEDKESKTLKKHRIQYEDIAVIVRSRGAFVDLLTQKLREESIPVTVLSSDTTAESFAAVSMLLSYLRLIDNARDDVNLAAVLLSPLFVGLRGEDLAEIRAVGKGAFCDCVYNGVFDGALGEKLQKFRVELTEFRRKAAEMTVAELAGEITSHYDCFAGALLLGGEREAAALDAFAEHLAAQTEHNTLHAYLRYIGRTGTPRLQVQDGGRAVKIMTVHASKGLEFHCVILPELQKKFNKSDVYSSVLCDKDEGVVMRSFDFAARAIVENPRFAYCSEQMNKRLTEEELRILYVAMTRAKHRLCLLARMGKSAQEEDEDESEQSTEEDDEFAAQQSLQEAGKYYDWLQELMTANAAEIGETQGGDDTPLPQVKDDALLAAIKATFATPVVHKQEGEIKTSVSGVVHADEEEQEHTSVLFEQDDRAAVRGSAYHKLMQWADFTSDRAWEKASKRFPQAADSVERTELETACKQIAAFIGGDDYVREQPFVLNLPRADVGQTGEGNILVQGVIDLLVLRAGGEADIVDYKTGSEDSIKRNEAYARQLGLYKTAAEKILGVRVRGTYLYVFSSGKLLPVTPVYPKKA